MGDQFITDTILKNELYRERETLRAEIRGWLDNHEKAEFSKHDAITQSLEDLTSSVKALTDAFAQGKGAVFLIKWLAILVAGGWALLVWAKDHLRI